VLMVLFWRCQPYCEDSNNEMVETDTCCLYLDQKVCKEHDLVQTEETEELVLEDQMATPVLDQELTRWSLEDRIMDMQQEAVQRSTNEAQESKKLEGIECARHCQQRDSKIKRDDHCQLDGGSALQPQIAGTLSGA